MARRQEGIPSTRSKQQGSHQGTDGDAGAALDRDRRGGKAPGQGRKEGEGPEPLAARAANRLHSAAIHLLRTVRREDPASGLSPARLSALSVLVYAGPMSLGELAAAEQVRPPTMTRLVQALEAAGLVERRRDPDDARITRLSATGEGRRTLEEARRRRLAHLAEALAHFEAHQLQHLLEAAELLEEAFGPGAAHRGEIGGHAQA